MRRTALGLADFKTTVMAKLTTLRRQSFGADTSMGLDQESVRIGGRDLDEFHTAWVGAVAACAASNFEVRYSYATGSADALRWSSEVVSPLGDSMIVSEQYLPDILPQASVSEAFLELFPPPNQGRGKRTRSNSFTADRGEGASKATRFS